MTTEKDQEIAADLFKLGMSLKIAGELINNINRDYESIIKKLIDNNPAKKTVPATELPLSAFSDGDTAFVNTPQGLVEVEIIDIDARLVRQIATGETSYFRTDTLFVRGPAS